MSDLWVICAEQTFSATGSPTCLAISTASSAEPASPPGTTGTPASASSRRASTSDQGPAGQAAGEAGPGRAERAGRPGARTRPRFSSQRSAWPSAPIPRSSPPRMLMPCRVSSPRP